MFWKKRQQVAAGATMGMSSTIAGQVITPIVDRMVKEEEKLRVKVERLPGPKELHIAVGRDLVTKFKNNPDWVWNLRGVERKRPERKELFHIRDPCF